MFLSCEGIKIVWHIRRDVLGGVFLGCTRTDEIDVAKYVGSSTGSGLFS